MFISRKTNMYCTNACKNTGAYCANTCKL